ncbi:MAG: CBM20 domain-containing protein [Bacteroidales bacterium]|nr:CBM20 domain-containing protein [Bacteroidales bacterium]MDY6170260.1 CBM20 domain-containing protein [Candidatus Cryptobacteroides sp.]
MKTNKLIAAALLPLLFSCAKENIAPAETPENADDYITVNLVPGADTVTKASFDDNDGIIWQKGGFAGIVNAAGENIKSKELDNIYTWNGNNQASFKFLKTELEGMSGPYVLYYPHHDEVSGSDGKYTIPIFVPVKQDSDIGKSTEIFSVVSKKAFDLVPYEKTQYDNNGADVEFKVVGSYIRILPYGGTKEGEILDYIKIYDIKGENWVSGRYFVSVAVNNDNTTTISKTDASDLLSNEIILNFGAKPNTKIDKADAKGIYAQVRSGKHQLAYELHTKVGDMECTYTFKSSQETDFAFGSIKDIPLNIAKAETTMSIPEELYIVGDACESGWDASKAVRMDKGENNTFTAELFLQKGEQGFKLLTRKGIYEYCYVNDGNGNMVYYNNPGDADKKFNVDGFALYKVTADFNTGKLTCEALAPYLVSDFTSYHFGGQDEPLQMKATDTPGVFKAEKVRIYNKSHEGGYYTNAFKFAFKKTDGADIDYTFSIQPANDKNYEIALGQEYYKNGKSKVDVLSKTFDTRFVGISGSLGTIKNDSEGKEIDYKWTVKETYNDKYYDVLLNLNNSTMTLSLHQGKVFKLAGINKISSGDLPAATVDANGTATWTTIYVDTATEGWDGTFKICGENTISQNSSDDSFREGEWYYSQLDWEGAWWWHSGTYGSTTPVLIESSGDRKWKMTESGYYTIVFDTKNLTLKVTKNN